MKLHLEGKIESNRELVRADEEALLASGFLTRATISITNLSFTTTNRFLAGLEVQRRLLTVQNIEYRQFTMERRDQAVFVCRPDDLQRIRARVQVP
jgi:hypothetical protein